ncbi:MAG: TetR/AcrR family transcriptional regulator [Myxococcota bacterium]|nr:TetR/AcrR family transcriptional regulator [Myxococcota bacterium]
MARKSDKRAEVVEKLAGHVLSAGLGDTGLRRLAEVAGTSDRMLLYYFENKEELLSAVLERITSDLAESLEALAAGGRMPPARALQLMWAALKLDANADQLRLWLDLSSAACRGDPFYRSVVTRIRQDWMERLSAILDTPPRERAALATLMMAAVDGQVVLFPEDLAEGDAAIAAFVSLLERGRRKS